MLNQRLIIILLCVLFAIQIAFGVLFFASTKKENKNSAALTNKTAEHPSNNNSSGTTKEQRYDDVNKQISEASKTCDEVLGFSNITEKSLSPLMHKQNIIELVGDYFSCEAASSTDISKCDALKNIDHKVYQRCAGGNIFMQMIKEKCSDESIKRCKNSGALKESECSADICEVAFDGKTGICEEVKKDAGGEAESYQSCLSIAKNDINSCNGLDTSSKNACMDEYYRVSAVKNNDSSLADKINNTPRKLAVRAFIDKSFSCSQEFAKFAKESPDSETYRIDCLHSLTGDYNEALKEAKKLEQEIKGQ
ncbi:MAG TPA: hypothetical protein VI998_03615 [Patescibacteria group bacterium]|nr:hypothetical protein [Patescibacteria group bacterium]